ncbi:MAG: rod shape-determining protein RodA [Neisseriaceae bacterium]|nr:rod shape-determining protein RodA [Neisseriaceae bacterium]MBP6861705.1 rod shape-determining protein RodA [Neisseriaceae bacterium]
MNDRTNHSPWQRFWHSFVAPFDWWLMSSVIVILIVSFFLLYSADGQTFGQIANKGIHTVMGFIVMWVLAKTRPQFLSNFALPLYLIGVVLLVGVELFGITVNGSTRWLNLGIARIQPSEVMKIGVPMMVAWYFQRKELELNWRHYLVALLIIMVPGALILKQPDLGTAMLIMSAGIFVIFFAGLPWKVIIAAVVSAIFALPLVWLYGMHEYQQTRVLTLLDPTKDSLGAGYHIIQSTIAIGSGGVFGKGWLNGTQTHLSYIPERTTDFIFAVYSEEFGLVGNILLLIAYLVILGRGLVIAAKAPTLYGKLLASALTMTFFCYAFVNMGMVSGILPVVGVPLPLMSYGGTSTLSITIIIGLLMGIGNQRLSH